MHGRYIFFFFCYTGFSGSSVNQLASEGTCWHLSVMFRSMYVFYTFLSCIKMLLRAPPAGTGDQAQGTAELPQLQLCACFWPTHTEPAVTTLLYSPYLDMDAFYFRLQPSRKRFWYPISVYWDAVLFSRWLSPMGTFLSQAPLGFTASVPTSLSWYKLHLNTSNAFPQLHRFPSLKSCWFSQAPALIQFALVANRNVHKQFIWQESLIKCPIAWRRTRSCSFVVLCMEINICSVNH